MATNIIPNTIPVTTPVYTALEQLDNLLGTTGITPETNALFEHALQAFLPMNSNEENTLFGGVEEYEDRYPEFLFDAAHAARSNQRISASKNHKTKATDPKAKPGTLSELQRRHQKKSFDQLNRQKKRNRDADNELRAALKLSVNAHYDTAQPLLFTGDATPPMYESLMGYAHDIYSACIKYFDQVLYNGEELFSLFEKKPDFDFEHCAHCPFKACLDNDTAEGLDTPCLYCYLYYPYEVRQAIGLAGNIKSFLRANFASDNFSSFIEYLQTGELPGYDGCDKYDTCYGCPYSGTSTCPYEDFYYGHEDDYDYEDDYDDYEDDFEEYE